MNQPSTRTTPDPTAARPARGYETSDTRGRAIFIGLFASVLAVTLIVVALNELFVMTHQEVNREQVGMSVNPALGENSAAALRNISSYEWVDSAAGVVRIPVERAMELMVEEAYRERRAEVTGE